MYKNIIQHLFYLLSGLIIYLMIGGNSIHAQNPIKEWAIKDTALLYSRWYGKNSGSICFSLDGVSMKNPINLAHSVYPGKTSVKDSLYINFDGDIFGGRYHRRKDSLFLEGKLEGKQYSWKYKYDERESNGVRRDAWRYTPRDRSPAQQVKGRWIGLSAGEDYTSADLAIDDTTILLVDQILNDGSLIFLPYYVKQDTIYWKVGNNWCKGIVKMTDGIISIGGRQSQIDPPFDIGGDYQSFPEFEKKIRMKQRAERLRRQADSIRKAGAQ